LNTVKAKTHCLYCSLGCPVGVEKRPHGIVQPTYVQGADSFTNGRLCYRGHYAAALLSHPKRLVEAVSKQDGEGNHSHEALLAEAAGMIRNAGKENSLGVILSGNLPTSELWDAAQFLQNLIPSDHIGIFIPPSDHSMLGGLSACTCKAAGWEDLTKAQTVFAVGDVLGTHPVLGHALMDILEKNPKTGLLNLDVIQGRTMRFASQGMKAKIGYELHALLGLASVAGVDIQDFLRDAPDVEELLSAAEISKADAERCVDAIRTSKQAVLLLTLPHGRNVDGELMALAAGRLCKATKAKLMPLFIQGGSAGAYGVAKTLGLSNTAQWLRAAREGKFDTIFCADVDLAGCLPDDLYKETVGKAESLVVAASMPSLTVERADISLPLAFWFEMEGQVLDYQGESVRLSALHEPAGGALSLVNLLNLLAETSGTAPIDTVELNLSEKLGSILNSSEVPAPLILRSEPDSPPYPFTLISRTETLDLYEGGVSRMLDWPGTIEAEPAILIHPDDVDTLGIADQAIITLRNEFGSSRLMAKRNAAVPVGTAAIPATLPAMRNFFHWELGDKDIEIRSLPAEIAVPTA